MEIEIDVVQLVVLESFQRTFVRLLDRFLVPFLIDQVDQDLGTVERDLLRKVTREGIDLHTNVRDRSSVDGNEGD
jgi:hypothetical protein